MNLEYHIHLHEQVDIKQCKMWITYAEQTAQNNN